jgi:hypothetical protein
MCDLRSVADEKDSRSLVRLEDDVSVKVTCIDLFYGPPI